MIVLRHNSTVIRSVPETMTDSDSIQLAVNILSRRRIEYVDVYVDGRYIGKAWRDRESGHIRHAVQIEFEY